MVAKIVLVEDDMANARAMIQPLELWGHVVLHADCGREGLRLIHTHRPDLILMTMNLADLNYDTLVARLNRASWMKHVPIVGIAPEDPHLITDGCQPYLPQPINENLLYEIVEYSLDRLH